MNRALLQGSWCHSCRHEIIRSFSSISGVPVPRYALPRRQINYNLKSRSFSSLIGLRSKSTSANNSGSPEAKDLRPEDETPSQSQHIPWYLQEDRAVSEQPVVSRDQIPELPEDPPAILPVLLDYTFKELGLDELKLLDLRSLETPPALGANVIMIIGTARSVKHLNVSADRLCRWLRSTYKLTPYADGLLGRNELKIKLRRKAKRARIASQAGTTVDEKDDGITTGWICVNAGVVEASPIQEQVREQGFEGFGRTAIDTRIVVQMFTEEKRADIDLETLWGRTLKRAEREREKFFESNSDGPATQDPFPARVNASSSDHSSRGPSASSASFPFEQRRKFHSMYRINAPHIQHNDPVTVTAPAPPFTSPATEHSASHTLGLGSRDSLFSYLSGLPHQRARDELGNGPEDRDSSLFLQLFYSQPSDSPAEEAIFKVRLACMAISRQHPAYRKEDLWEDFLDCTSSGYHISDELGLDIVSALFTERPTGLEIEQTSNRLPDSDMELALRVLEHLSLRGTNVLNTQVIDMLHTVAGQTNAAALSRISEIMNALDAPSDPEEARALMTYLFQTENYDGFWKIWRKLALSGRPRTAADYERLFQLHADLGHEHQARDCILTWVPMMKREEPPIPLQGALAQHIMYCLLLADPAIQQKAEEGLMNNFTRTWNECRSSVA